MIRRPPRSTLSSSSAASDVYKRQVSSMSNRRRSIPTPIANGTEPGQPQTRVADKFADKLGVLAADPLVKVGEGAPFRTDEERASAPDRLNLDCRGLSSCAQLVGEERLRLLNYQNNQIKAVSNMTNLRCLVFLDLYNNQIEKIENLEALSKLRVLMMGKNKISRVENLEALSSLEVLDLHSNQISRIEGLSHLRELRVLNMAGNHLTEISGLGKFLEVLAEINLRHNQITHSTDTIPSLQRLFLSNNHLPSATKVDSLLQNATKLVELCLDNNPAADEPMYRAMLVDQLPSLRHLDLKRVTAEERRTASVSRKREDERLASIAHQTKVQTECEAAIAEVAALWRQKERGQSIGEGNGFSIVDGLKLSLYGDTSDELLSVYPHCVHLSLNYMDFDQLVKHLAKAHARSDLISVTLSDNHLTDLAQLRKCCAMLTKVPELSIVNNQASGSILFRPLVVHLVHALHTLNGKPVTCLLYTSPSPRDS
eukprot:TRINITY_DN27739_c0_g1_i1.p1 TRINITY_DN27739_c0_g1~~TRINITY_DN27739_c0_g1_i1.p1  ORF type:complete len:484 (+),score=129.99 TRINITY_DN27739_c0_g1_i1:152-1603(+)